MLTGGNPIIKKKQNPTNLQCSTFNSGKVLIMRKYSLYSHGISDFVWLLLFDPCCWMQIDWTSLAQVYKKSA